MASDSSPPAQNDTDGLPFSHFIKILFPALIFLVLLCGCFARRFAKGPGDPDWGVRVTWFGHSCFSFEDSTGRTFLIDPFDETVGYDLAWIEPDAVLVTHAHFDHNYLRRGVRFEVMQSTGVATVDGIEVTGVLGYHDDQLGRRHGNTIFFAWEMAGLKFVHLGDVGQSELTQEQMNVLSDPDVLFLPVGGQTTVNAEGAARLARFLRPRIIVPMHYGNPRVRFFEFDPVEPFLAQYQDVRRLEGESFHLRRQDLPASPTVYSPAVPRGKG